MSSQPVYRAALIGCGKADRPAAGKTTGGFRIGYAHARAARDCPRVQMVAAADIDAENLAAFQREFDVEHGFADYRGMLDAVKPDILSICTYVGLHRPMIEAAVAAGVHGILCEKPFVASPADLLAVRKLAAATGVKICICHQRRTLGLFDRARQLYNDGTVGRRVLCAAGIADWDLSEWGSHWLDMFRFFHNDEPVEWVMCQGRVRDLRGFGHAMESHAVATFQFAGGGMGLVDAGHAVTDPHTMVLLGSEGAVRVVKEKELIVETAAGHTTETDTWDPARNNGFANMAADMVAWLDGGGEPVTALSRTYGSAELNLAAYISIARGDRVDLPLDEAARRIDAWPLEAVARKWAGVAE